MLAFFVGFLYEVLPLLLKFGDSLFHNLLASCALPLFDKAYMNKGTNKQLNSHHSLRKKKEKLKTRARLSKTEFIDILVD